VAAKELIRLIEKPKTTVVEQVIIPGQLIEGKSVGRVS
jgi:DNA-binding LacI/PurR family transcriptional regulator